MANNRQNLETEVAGIRFPNPVGIPHTVRKRRWICFKNASKASFLLLTPPPQGSVLDWIRGLEQESSRDGQLIAVNLNSDIARSFSLVYDFADFIVIEPDSDNGIGATDISDTQELLEEIVGLRLCYERYTPVFLRLSHGTTREELGTLLDSCRLWGLDGVVAPNLACAARVKELTQGRLPLVTRVETAMEGIQALEEGASLLEVRCEKEADKLLKTLELKAPKHD